MGVELDDLQIFLLFLDSSVLPREMLLLKVGCRLIQCKSKFPLCAMLPSDSTETQINFEYPFLNIFEALHSSTEITLNLWNVASFLINATKDCFILCNPKRSFKGLEPITLMHVSYQKLRPYLVESI